jgi:hypothetical protein
LHSVHKLSAGHRPRKWFAVALVVLDDLLYDPTKLIEDGTRIVAMTAPQEQLGATTDETPILVRPFHQLDVSIAFAHRLDSSIAIRTAFSW